MPAAALTTARLRRRNLILLAFSHAAGQPPGVRIARRVLQGHNRSEDTRCLADHEEWPCLAVLWARGILRQPR